MPAEIQQPLAVLFTLPDGVIHHGVLHGLPNQQLAADLAVGLVAATHPHGPIRTRSVARQYMTTMRRMARDLTALGFTGGLADLTPATLVQYWLTCDYHRERRIRVVLNAFQETAGGLDPGICRHLAGRRINKVGKSRPNQPYSDGEWRRLEASCVDQIAAARRTHRQALEAAGRGADPSVHGVTFDNLAWLWLHAGPAEARRAVERSGARGGDVDRAQIAAVEAALFPASETAFAYLTLFAMRTGIVPDGIDALRLDNITRTSANTVLLSYRKGRTGDEALNLPRDAVRLLDRWLEHSAQLREHAGDLADRLWIYVGRDGLGRGQGRIYDRPRGQRQRRAWTESSGVLGDDGRPLPVHGGRVRATYHHRRDRTTWTGRTTIDPNHSARVEGDHYLSSHTPAQLDALEGVIEQAQGDVRRKAAPPVVISSEDAAAFAADFPRLVEDAGLDAAAIKALLSGEQDMFVAACASPLNGPHAPAGTLCPARPWVCLLCPLAAFAPRHLPNLLRLKEYFSRQAQQMTTGQFLRIFGPYTARLDEDILPRFGPAAIEAATRQSAEPAAFLPLHLEEQPQ
ncbi:hypothetical protein [Streptomyces gossypiisoli]|uniref:hypothetical protein n=1 Tax=Streptomyces gossypiisoli TaxID=2748864 RepID=UPI0015DB01A0|nr:hypothetical protein [Streptomyces gossypiisoli]